MSNALEAQLKDAERRLASEPDSIDALFLKAQILARLGRDEEAKSAFVAVLVKDPAHVGALMDLGGLALATGYRSAAVTAYRQAVECHPGNPLALVNLANILLEDGALHEARLLYEKALAIDANLIYAHQGLANVLDLQGYKESAARHREEGFAGHSIVARPYRGTGQPLRVLLIVSAIGGNIPTHIILDDRIFAVTAVYAEYYDPSQPLPEHEIVVNAVGDADLCEKVLQDDVARILAETGAPDINGPERVRNTGRVGNSIWLSRLEDVVVPKVSAIPRRCFEADEALELLDRDEQRFPLLLRSPGYHTGQHFIRVDESKKLKASAAELPGDVLFAIENFDTRGADGMVRKYRVMFIDGKLYPLHLAVSRDWKVHYVTSAMADSADFRREEETFLLDIEKSLGSRAIRGLEQLRHALRLDYGGADFTLLPDGRVLLFEANATMAIVPPPPDSVWDYRRAPIAAAIDAARAMLLKRAGRNDNNKA